MSDTRLGILLDGTNQERDSVHVPVLPVRASEDLNPGDKITFVGSSRTEVKKENYGLGIVDPFLDGPVKKGQWFHMCLKPGDIDGLKHTWHVSWLDSDKDEKYVDIFRDVPKNQQEAKSWLKNFCDMYSMDYDELVHQAQMDGGYFVVNGQDCHSRGEFPKEPQVWTALELLLERKFSEEYRAAFVYSCSC